MTTLDADDEKGSHNETISDDNEDEQISRPTNKKSESEDDYNKIIAELDNVIYPGTYK